MIVLWVVGQPGSELAYDLVGKGLWGEVSMVGEECKR